MQAIFSLPALFTEDLGRFREQTERFRRGELSAAEYRAFRVPRGVYEQREAGTFMLRVRLPAGVVLPHQMRVLARVAGQYGNGLLHVTTRQDIQVHRVVLDHLHPALEELHGAGLSTQGGGGNTVRNITACCDAGVCPHEALDVSPYVVALTEFLLPDPLSYQLPRKYKAAFCGCAKDCAGGTVNDLGFIARGDGAPGFRVYVGGGMGAHSRVGQMLEEFVPAGEVHLAAEAVKRVFDQYGNRKNRHRARLRFLLEQIGLGRFKELYQEELAGLRSASPPGLTVRAIPGRTRPPSAAGAAPGRGFAEWRATSVMPQKQAGYFMVLVSPPLGNFDARTFADLADVVERHGEGAARTTQRQGLVLRWIHESELAELHAALSPLGLAGTDAPILRNLVACAGAATCRLGICLSQGLAGAIRSELSSSRLALEKLGELKINISGCPNSCGRHPVADIGFFGAARRVKGRLMPYYVLQLGGGVVEGRTRLAEGNQPVPARRVPALLAELLEAFQNSPQCPDFSAFLEAQGKRLAERLALQSKDVPDGEEESYALDWGAQQTFSLAGRGAGECGAGVFDLIEVDLASARDAVRQNRLFEATVLAARALLVTRGEQARDESEALELFTKLFLDEKLIDDSFARLLGEARKAARDPQPGRAFAGEPGRVQDLVEAVGKLYEGMDSSLRFKAVRREVAPAPTAAEPPPAVDREADFRGVVCPLNYVKTKLVLDQMASGQTLSVLLDAPGARSVPESVEKDGHRVLSVAQAGEQWRVVIRRA